MALMSLPISRNCLPPRLVMMQVLTLWACNRIIQPPLYTTTCTPLISELWAHNSLHYPRRNITPNDEVYAVGLCVQVSLRFGLRVESLALFAL